MMARGNFDKYITMIFALTMMAIAISISAIAAWYSIAGLTAIFAAAVVPVIIMGGALEAGKIIATVWLHNNWERITWVYKAYLVPAIVFLMIITSMGIFGFLSKAHSDQSLVSGDSMSKVAVYDEQIKTERDNIEANKKALSQMDAQVDQMLGRTDSDKGAERAVSIRKQQSKERASLQSDITKSQKAITKLQAERAPLAAEFRKIEAEVGPIKYIAAFIYGDNPDQNVLEKAVRWVIILIVVVFDPLALCLILAANKHLEWMREDKNKRREEDIDDLSVYVADVTMPDPEEDDDEIPEGLIKLFQDGRKRDSDIADEANAKIDELDPPEPVIEVVEEEANFVVEKETVTSLTDEEDEAFAELDAKLNAAQSANPEPLPVSDFVAKSLLPEAVDEDEDTPYPFPLERPIEGIIQETTLLIAEPVEEEVAEEELEDAEGVTVEAFRKLPGDYVEYEGKHMHQRVLKDSHPELFALREDTEDGITTGFGIEFPKFAVTGDVFVRVDSLPNRVFKFNRSKWVEIAREQSDTYLHNDKYMKYLVDKIGAGEIDPEILTSTEQDLLEQFIKKPR